MECVDLYVVLRHRDTSERVFRHPEQNSKHRDWSKWYDRVSPKLWQEFDFSLLLQEVLEALIFQGFRHFSFVGLFPYQQ